ncbi:energy transducer TonB, partial [Klebsiella quasipneumoniae]
VQNVKILESTTTPELEHQIIDKMIKKWRFEKGKPGIAQRLVVKIPPKSDGGPANKQ